MNKLVVIQNRQAVTTSLQIAESFEKRHDHVLRSIETLLAGLPEIREAQMFFASTYEHPQNKQSYKMYYMNRDGFSLLAMGFTGDKALDFKIQYIQAFNAMEDQLQPQALSEKEQLKASMRLSLETSEEVEALKSEVSEVKETVQSLVDTMRIDGTQEFALNSQGKAKVLQVLGGYDSAAYKSIARKVFSELWREFKRHFQLPRYSELPKTKFNDAVYFISKWRPSTSLEIEIEVYNKQTHLTLVKAE